MDHKEREGKANLAPVSQFIRRVFSNMGRIREGRNEFAVNCEALWRFLRVRLSRSQGEHCEQRRRCGEAC
jgi:hypothetical protein